MEAINGRVESSSSRRARSKQSLKSFAESPPSQIPKKSRKKRKRESEPSSEIYWDVRDIVDEKIERGEIKYLIDWKDNPETGEKYKPSWEPQDFVTKKAVRAWKKKKSLIDTEKSRRSQGDRAQSISSSDPHSQPVRIATRHRLSRPQNPPSPSQTPWKRPRRAGTAETARFQSVSQDSIESQAKPQEIKDSYEEQSESTEGGHVHLEIVIDEAVDPEAYSKVIVSSSQPSQFSQTTKLSPPSQCSQASHTPFWSQYKTQKARPFIWDEEEGPVTSVPITQDSQSVPGSSSYVPSQTHESLAFATIGVKTSKSDLPTNNLPLRASAAAKSSARSSESSRTSDLENFQPSARLVDASGEAQSRQPSTISHRSQGSYILHSSVNFGSSPNPADQGDLGCWPETFESVVSPEPPISSEAYHTALAEGSFPQATSHTLSQVQLYQPASSASDESCLRFQTQVPLPTLRESKSPKNSRYGQVTSLKRTLSPTLSHPEKLPEISGLETLAARPLEVTSNSVHCIETVHQAVRTYSTSPEVYIQQGRSSESKLSERVSAPPEIGTQPDGHAASNLSEGDLCSEQLQGNVLPSVELIVDPIFLPIMADQAMSTAEKLRRARSVAAESKMAEQRAARTASAIPHTPPPATPPPTNRMLPLRETVSEEVVHPYSIDQNPKLSSSACNSESSNRKDSPKEEEKPARGVQLLPLGDNVFAVPLPMVSLARDIYDQEITNYRPQRQSLLSDDRIDRGLVDDIDKMLERLKLICDHQDLIDAGSASQAMEPDHRQAKWAENISTKCIFLAEFFDSLRSSASHVVILVRPGRMMDILEALFRIHAYHYTRPDRSIDHSGQGLMKISLLPTNLERCAFTIEPASLIVAFDSTFSRKPWVDTIRADPLNVHRLVPLAYLLITHSVEHLELCLTNDMDQLDRKALLVSWLSYTREEIGKLDLGYPSPDTAAKSLAAYISGVVREWPLLPMPVMEEIELPVITVRASTEGQLSGSTTQSYDVAPSSTFHPAFKRPRLEEGSAESTKRQRLTPFGDFDASGPNISRIDETYLAAKSKADIEAKEARDIILEADAPDTTQEAQISSLLQKLTELEIQIQTKETAEVELRQANQRLQARVDDYDKSIEKILPRYQEALNDRGQAAHDVQESMARESSMRQKLDTRTTELAILREQKVLVDKELVAARTALSSSSIPEVAELQRLKDELSVARVDMEKAQKKIANAQNDMEYMRNNYQKASSAAAEMRNELDELKAQNATLARKASENTVEIHRIQSVTETKQYLQLISELEVEKAAVERELEKKSEELRSIQNGRRATRGTSVPRSPRMGTMSPGQASRPMARVLGNVGSRGTSPGPGSSETGYRGPLTFGDALLPPLGPPNRWGNHLS